MRTIEEVTKSIANYWIYNLSNSEIKTADDECNYLKRLLNEIIEIHKAEKRPKGKWIPMKKAKDNPFYIKYQCSECGCLIIGGKDNFCPNCGADMRESEEK